MPRDRHPDTLAVRTLGLRPPRDHRIEPHVHGWHQLVYATDGVMSVETSVGTWVVPPQRAVWIPAGFEHAVNMTGHVRVQTIYLRPDLGGNLPATCCVMNVTPLLRELILETLRMGQLSDEDPAHVHWIAVLLERLEERPEAPLELRLPTDARARRVAEQVLRDLSATTPIEQLAPGSGASVRTIERLFVRETGATFGNWRRRARVLGALRHLAAGESVTQAGLAVGYDSTSAFIAAFRRVIGVTPGSYFAGTDSS